MLRRPTPLLCELHAHTTWSDGELTVAELVDLFGRRGFDVLCVTDHTVREDDPWKELETWPGDGVTEETFGAYLDEIEREAERALSRYGMLVVPGLELTFNDVDPREAAHAVAIGLRSFVSVTAGIAEAIESAAMAGAALVAAHPNGRGPQPRTTRLTQRFAYDEALRRRVHRFELFNRTRLYPWIAESGLPGIAAGDVHRPEHLGGWKTLVPAERDEEALVSYLRSPRPVYLALLEAREERLAA
ncbi:MAG: PHP domain-containing protein [Thermoleophilia bacterium]|nr:PHP domain-containing protein [Thermoleophilia bacterium]